MVWTMWKLFLLSLLNIVSCQTNRPYHVPEIEGYDGWYNNLAHPEWGGADFPLTRRLPPNFADGVYQPSGSDRPNPLDVAFLTMHGATGATSRRNRTALLTFFGQQVVEEILDAQRPGCPPEYFNIPIPENHYLYNPNGKKGLAIPFLRSRYDKTTGQSPNNPRQQLNEITPWLDGGLHYGVTKAWADALRAHENGELKCHGNQNWMCDFPEYNTIGLPFANPPPPFDHKLKSARRFFKIGNPRGNENPMLLMVGIMWFRNHNFHAHRLKEEFKKRNLTCHDECLFNRARQWNIAEHQNIVLNIWLPSFLGSEITQYTGYKPSIHPGITHAFQTSAMRFGHTMIPPVAYRAKVQDGRCHFRHFAMDPHHAKSNDRASVRTCNSYWNSPEIVADGEGVDELAFGLAKQVTEREDNIITEDLQGFVFGSLDFSRRDLMALNIQRGRDHGLPDYNTAREVYGLKRIEKFEDINPRAFEEPYDEEFESVRQAINNLRNLSYTIDNIDLWPGGLLETVDSPGPLFSAIIKDQFERIRDGDRFWFENRQNGLFTDEEISKIRNTTFRDILTRNIRATWFKEDMLQKDVFHYNGESDEIWPAFQTDGCKPSGHTIYNETNLADYLDACTPMKTFDYFDGSEGPYIGTLVALGLYLLLNLLIMVVAVRYFKQKSLKTHNDGRHNTSFDVWQKAGVFSTANNVPMVCDELLVADGTRKIVIAPIRKEKQLKVYDAVSGSVVRTIDLCRIPHVEMQVASQSEGAFQLQDGVVLLRFANLYDIAMRFPGSAEPFCEAMADFLQNINITNSRVTRLERDILSDCFTKEDRQALVEEFFRLLFRETLADSDPKKPRRVFRILQRGRSTRKKRQILELELTKSEFAEAMGMKPSSIFVQQVFKLVDEDESGTVSFQEFLKFLVLFTSGSPDSKVELMFNIYDIDGNGTLERSEFTDMLKHLIESANESVDLSSLEAVVTSMLENAGLADKEILDLDDFKRMFAGYKNELNDAAVQVHGKTARKNLGPTLSTDTALSTMSNGAVTTEPITVDESFDSRRKTVRNRKAQHVAAAYTSQQDEEAQTNVHIDPLPIEEEIGDAAGLSKGQQKLLAIQRIWENYRLHIFWFVLYELVVLAIFAERAYYYSVEREHAGLRRIAGYGVTVTRGAASAMMFTYSSLLVTMSRNIITKLRETFLNRYIPFDAAHAFHKVIAMTALVFTAMHCIGHGINFYHIATQTANDLTCLFREYYHLSDELPKFQFWMFNTLTGVTGFLLVLVIITIYVFAVPYARRYLFKTFWYTHHLYIPLYALLILHGSGRLVQPALFQWFFVFPVSVFAIDKLISFSRQKVELVVYKAEKLPSGVTHLQFKKPTNFDYRSGQWVRIACLALNSQEYHPFTLTSAPAEPTLDLFIRAVGPWTQNLRTVYDPENPKNRDLVSGNLVYPRLYMDGPFGEGHQDWYKFEIAVLVGGGIGVTPFASILKDLVHKEQLNSHLVCKKVYFLWVTRTQKQFEWMTDIIRQVEEQDKNGLTDIHIFITQFYQKFDLRTIMLYICERHFQKISNRSLFSGLRSVTHFGRPQFDSFFEGLQELHNDVGQIGVFSCGPPPMTRSVEAGCAYCNQIEGPVFIHHFENF